MIRHLSIRNYILIDQLELDFKSGLNIVTGETGAGKSILMGALDLISGGPDAVQYRMVGDDTWLSGMGAYVKGVEGKVPGAKK